MILPFLLLISIVGCSNDTNPVEMKLPPVEVKEATITPIKTESAQHTPQEQLIVAPTSENKINPAPKPVTKPKYKQVCRTVKVNKKNTVKCKTIGIYKKYPGTPVPKHKR